MQRTRRWIVFLQISLIELQEASRQADIVSASFTIDVADSALVIPGFRCLWRFV